MEREREREGETKKQTERWTKSEKKKGRILQRKQVKQRQKYEIRSQETVKGERACVLCLFMCMCACVCVCMCVQKMTWLKQNSNLGQLFQPCWASSARCRVMLEPEEYCTLKTN